MLHLLLYKDDGFRWTSWGWTDRPEHPDFKKGVFLFALQEGSGFLQETNIKFDRTDHSTYDAARCGAFADWLDEHRDRLLEPHTDLRAEAEERLDSLIKWLRSGLQVEG